MPNNWRSIAFTAGVPLLCACLLLAARGLLRPEPSSTLSTKLEGVVGRWAADKGAIFKETRAEFAFVSRPRRAPRVSCCASS